LYLNDCPKKADIRAKAYRERAKDLCERAIPCRGTRQFIRRDGLPRRQPPVGGSRHSRGLAAPAADGQDAAMNRLLQDLRIVEISAFVAGPLGGMTLAQMGADVIRIDPIGGGIDFARWPVTGDGASLYWAGLNKAKRSLALALDKPEGREIARALVTAPGPGSGILLTNLPPLRGLDFASLKAARGDLIMLRLVGNRDGSAAVDYTVNAASGFPLVTGQQATEAGGMPVNHVLPAWDIAAGLYLATGLLAAERHRTRTGEGQEVVAALADIMLATVGNLGYIGDVEVNGHARPAIGNDLYGSFGRDFATSDGRRAMIIALTSRQWRALGQATGLAERLAMIGPMIGVDLDTEAGRYEARDMIAALVARWCAARSLDDIRQAFAGTGVLWGEFQDFRQLVRGDPRCSAANPLFATVEQPGIGRYLMPGLPLDFGAAPRLPPRPAPVLGEHSDAVLAQVLGLSTAEIGRLHDNRIVAGPGGR
jgi:2-methylfumaryl-CoA isomerase